MKKYLAHIKSKEPHERRQHAMQLAAVVTAAVFVVWVTTLGLRLSQSSGGQTAEFVGADGNNAYTAAVANPYMDTGNQLVSTSTSF